MQKRGLEIYTEQSLGGDTVIQYSTTSKEDLNTIWVSIREGAKILEKSVGGEGEGGVSVILFKY